MGMGGGPQRGIAAGIGFEQRGGVGAGHLVADRRLVDARSPLGGGADGDVDRRQQRPLLVSANPQASPPRL
jgi:hypothetical protein